MKLIDSSVWIRLFRRRSDPRLQGIVSNLIASGEAAINGIILVELLVGATNEQRFVSAQSNLNGIPSIPITSRTWNSAADLGFRLRRLGLRLEIPDVVIAASAIEHNIPLFHADSDFDRIAQRSTLQVESYA
jgi:predicted nucleic acid-binding protein